MRLAELGTVYRYEKSGVLHGLMRVRGFTQDDAHIFCTPDEIVEMVNGSPYSAATADEAGWVDGTCFVDELETVLSEHYDRRKLAARYLDLFREIRAGEIRREG